MTTKISTLRVPLLVMAILTLLAAMWGGLLRMGWIWPPLLLSLPMAHGPLMVGGFLGTVIGLERAVALGKPWPYAAPLLAGIGAILLMGGWGGPAGALLITLGSGVLVMALIVILRIHVGLDSLTIALGGATWLVGNLLWLAGHGVPQVVMWWTAFLVLTIAGERLELSRLLRYGRREQTLFGLTVGLILAGLGIMSGLDYALGVRVAGAGMLLEALWLLRYDIARRRLKAGGQARFVALALISGFVWLGIGGGLALVYGGLMAGPQYDAMLHALFLGYAISMVFGHAPIVFPAILRLPITYAPRFYSHLILLHAGLILRVVGDLWPWWEGRRWGGMLNVIALLLFLTNTVYSIVQSRRTQSQS